MYMVSSAHCLAYKPCLQKFQRIQGKKNSSTHSHPSTRRKEERERATMQTLNYKPTCTRCLWGPQCAARSPLLVGAGPPICARCWCHTASQTRSRSPPEGSRTHVCAAIDLVSVPVLYAGHSAGDCVIAGSPYGTCRPHSTRVGHNHLYTV